MSEVLRLIWIAALCLICPICSNGDRFVYLNVNSLASTADRILSRSAGSVFSELVYVILCAHAWILLCVSNKREVLLCPALCPPPTTFWSVWPQVIICVTNLPVLTESPYEDLLTIYNQPTVFMNLLFGRELSDVYFTDFSLRSSSWGAYLLYLLYFLTFEAPNPRSMRIRPTQSATHECIGNSAKCRI
jgi:hypothetical protein